MPRTHSDRFIPKRSGMDIEVAGEICSNDQDSAGVNASPARQEYKKELAASLGQERRTARVLAFCHKAPQLPPGDDMHSSTAAGRQHLEFQAVD